MELHASCAARDGAGVLLLGAPGAGKSDLLLRLLDHGFELVADDRVVIEGGVAGPRAGAEGLLEVRGLGIFRLRHVRAPVRLRVRLTVERPPRLPARSPDDAAMPAVPMIDLDPAAVSAAARVRLALDCLEGRVGQLAGFAVA